MRYLLDTNICIYLIKQQPAKLLKRFRTRKIDDICISSITVSELYYGAMKSMRPLENVAALKGFFEAFAIIEFNESDAFIYGKVRAKLEKAGKVIGAMDMLIASQALNRKLICVTNNEREFRRVEGLSVENWVK